MSFNSLATAALVPPINLAVIALLALLAGRRRLAAAALAVLMLLGMPLVAGRLVASLQAGQGAGDEAGAQAIVVLGAEVVLQADGQTAPGQLTLQRLRTAAALARRTGLPLLVSGGVTADGAAPVAAAMAASLRDDFALPPRWVEDQSADTFENARDSAALLAASGITNVLVVTHQWHMRRALLACRAAGVHAVAAPVPAAEASFGWDGLLPRASAWLTSYYALHEWIGLAWYAVRSRLP